MGVWGVLGGLCVNTSPVQRHTTTTTIKGEGGRGAALLCFGRA